MGYIWPKLWDIFGKNYGIYWAKTIGYIMGYIWKIVGYICKIMEFIHKDHGIILGKTMGYIGLRL